MHKPQVRLNRCGITIRRFVKVLRSVLYYAICNIIHESESKGNFLFFTTMARSSAKVLLFTIPTA